MSSQRYLSTLSTQEFDFLRSLALAETGIDLASNKRAMLSTRLLRRLRELQLDQFEDYLELLSSNQGAELRSFINLVTTNLTYFYREPHHFSHLCDEGVPALTHSMDLDTGFRLWSAGASSGQEPYSLAMALTEAGFAAQYNIRILATDIDTDMVRRVNEGEYGKEELRGLSETQRNKWFEQISDKLWRVRPSLQALVFAKQLNLFGAWPMRKKMHVIFCRNVMIYFNRAHQRRLVERFATQQNPGGLLYLGHSEALQDCRDLYARVSNSVYSRV